MQWILLAVATVSFVIYGLAIKKVFSREYGVDRRMTLLQVGGLFSAAVHLGSISLCPVPINRGVAALAVYATGLGVFFSAKTALAGRRLTLAFTPDAPTELITSGVYARVRHPFYLSYSLTWIGGLISAPSPWILATVIVMIAAYLYAARLEEAKFESSSLSSAYEAYRLRTGLFLPRTRHS